MLTPIRATPLADLNEVALEHGAVLYVDDAHGTGTLGERGRGTVLEALGRAQFDTRRYDEAAVLFG